MLLTFTGVLSRLENRVVLAAFTAASLNIGCPETAFAVSTAPSSLTITSISTGPDTLTKRAARGYSGIEAKIGTILSGVQSEQRS